MLEIKQWATIELAKRTGRTIAEINPEIADKYREGDSLTKIAREYSIANNYEVTKNIAINIIFFALRELIPESELERIGKEHLINRGKEAYKKGEAIFSISLERKKKIGEKLYKDKKGIFALSHEQLSENWKKGREKRATAQGVLVFPDEEKKYFLELCANPEYQYQKGLHNGRPIYTKIIDELENKFNVRRSINTLMVYKCLYKKQIKNQV